MEGKSHFLGELAALEFECSVSAAELSRSVGYSLFEAVRRGMPTQEIEVITGFNAELSSYNVVQLGWKPEVEGYDMQLVLAQKRPTGSVENIVEPLVAPKRFGFLRKSVVVEVPEETSSQEQPLESAFMAVKFGNELLLPIATFETQENSETCSYVQLGSEVRGEDFYSTKLDEQDVNRKQLVEDLRKIVNAGRHDEDINDVVSDSVSKLIMSEIDTHKEAVTLALEKQLVRSLSGEFDNNRQHTGAFTELRAGEAPREMTMRFRPVGLPTRYADTMTGYMVIATDEMTGEETFGVTARRTAYIPLAKISRTLEQFEPLYTDRLSPSQLQVLTGLVQDIPTNRLANASSLSLPNIQKNGTEMFRRLNSSIADELQRTLNMFIQAGTIGVYAVDKLSRHKTILDASAHYEMLPSRPVFADSIALQQLFDPVLRQGGVIFSERVIDAVKYSNRSDFDSSPPKPVLLLESINNYVKSFSPAAKQAVENLASNTLTDIINIQSEESELLIDKIADLSLYGTGHMGILHNVKIGSTVGDLSIKVNIERQGSEYVMTVSGRPSALESGVFSRLYQCSFDVARGTTLDDDRVSELLETLASLKPVIPQRKQV
jgi:hypothetical protein